jgi:hypothetical protein
MGIVGLASGEPEDKVFLSAMYGFSKLIFTLIASFFFIDALGRRKPLLIGVMTQMLSHIYIGVYVKKNQEGPVSNAASQTAIAALFIHAFGYAVGTSSPISYLTHFIPIPIPPTNQNPNF